MDLFSWEYLTNPLQKPENLWPYFVSLTVLIAISVILHAVADRIKIPRFQKRFLRKIADFLFYIPILFQFILLAMYTGVKSLSLPIYILLLGLIWLIWLCFLIYYRLVILKEFWQLYLKQKQEEKYIHGKSKASD
jgi:hypothetical protein